MDQIRRAGGNWSQVRTYHAEATRDTTALRMRRIVAVCRLEEAKDTLRAAVLSGRGDRWEFDQLGRAFSALEELRREIREHKVRVSEWRQRLEPLP